MADPASIIDAVLANPPVGTVVVAFSGGMDSTVLLHALAKQSFFREQGLRAIHVDHGLHPDSADWAIHCRDVGRALGVAVDVVATTVRNDGEGGEAAARRARWAAFSNAVQAHECIALAHHRDDQAETVLLRLMRGAGPAGLSAMNRWTRRDDGLHVWRPFLDVGRTDLSAWATSAGLHWIDDPANDAPAFDRNHVRHLLMPALRMRWPAAAAILAHVGERQADAYALERDVGNAVLVQAATPDTRVLHLGPLRDASRPARWAALRLWLATHGARDQGARCLHRIDAELIQASDDAGPRIDLGGCVIRRYRDTLHALHPGSDTVVDYNLAWTGQTPLVLPARIGVLRIEPGDGDALPMTVRNRAGGERLRMRHDGPRRELKHVLQDYGVPPWQRARWPVVLLDGEVAGFADIAIGASLQSRLDAHGARLHFDPH